jgi:hypothetical protein
MMFTTAIATTIGANHGATMTHQRIALEDATDAHGFFSRAAFNRACRSNAAAA